MVILLGNIHTHIVVSLLREAPFSRTHPIDKNLQTPHPLENSYVMESFAFEQKKKNLDENFPKKDSLMEKPLG